MVVRLVFVLLFLDFISGKKIIQNNCQVFSVYNGKIKCEKSQEFSISIHPIRDAIENFYTKEFNETVFTESVIFKRTIRISENGTDFTKLGNEDNEDVEVPIYEENANLPMVLLTPLAGIFGVKIVLHILSV